MSTVTEDVFNGRLWIGVLCAFGVANAYFYFRTLKAGRETGGAASGADGAGYSRAVTFGGIYLFVCVYRSVFMTDTHARMCFTDTVMNWPIVNRTLAAVAEISFGILGVQTLRAIAVAVHAVTGEANWSDAFTRFLVPFGSAVAVLSNCCSHFGVITHHSFPLIIEECGWFVYATTATLAAYALSQRLKRASAAYDPASGKPNRLGGADWSVIRRLLDVLSFAGFVFAVYLITIDIPMYIRQYVRESAPGSTHAIYSLGVGLIDSSKCDITTQQWTKWTGVWLWQTLYFIFGPFSTTLQLRLLQRVHNATISGGKSD